MTGRYNVRNGRIFAQVEGEEREVTTAVTSNGRDLAQFEEALARARAQREAALRDRASLTGVVDPVDRT
jgi:uncharacterized protein YyaL (SSP411 family)